MNESEYFYIIYVGMQRTSIWDLIKVKHIKNKSFMNCVLLLKGRNMHLKDLFNLKPAFQHQRSMGCLIKLCSIDFSSQVHQRIHFSPSNDAEPKVLH